MLKRTIFTSIQRSHVIPVLGGVPALVRTGYEPMIAKRTNELFSYAAKGDGVIREINNYQVVVEYDEQKLGREIISIGDKIIKSKDSVVIHPLVCDLPIGYRFSEDEILIYNKNYFTRDLLQPTEVILIDQSYATTVLIENNDTLEDSGVIIENYSKNMLTPVTKAETIIVAKNITINNLIKIGEKVEVGDILCILEDEFINKNTTFDEESKEALEEIQRNSPRSNYSGTIRRIECIYFCDFNDLSNSLKTIAKESDKQFYHENKGTEKDNIRNGKITIPSRVNGKLVNMDEVAINIYIDYYDTMSSGDKDVNANQMKSVISKVYHGVNKTKSGVPIDDVFSYTSIGNRIVDSPILIGLYGSGMLELNKRAIRAYRGNK